MHWLVVATIAASWAPHLTGSAGRSLHQDTDATDSGLSLLKSLHCFSEEGTVTIASTEWEPAAGFLVCPTPSTPCRSQNN